MPKTTTTTIDETTVAVIDGDTCSYSLLSSPMVHAPGLVRWCIAAYQTGDSKIAITVMKACWAGIDHEHLRLLLSGQVQFTEVTDPQATTTERMTSVEFTIVRPHLNPDTDEISLGDQPWLRSLIIDRVNNDK